ncbi:hypothetical protein BH11BAC4_BH11BAC4_23280 [soil metagenome]
MITATHLHAMLIHFPIALLLVGFLSEVISLITKKAFFKNAAIYLLLLGALGTTASYLSGNVAGEGIEAGALKNAIELHEQAATTSLWLSIITAIIYLVVALTKYKKVWTSVVSVVLFTAMIFSIARTGYLGGQLVYKHGAGVELLLPDF